jgi:hypothetical protein
MRSNETVIAQEIVKVLPEGSVARLASDDQDSIRFAVQSATLKLRSIIFSRSSLRRLLTDAQRAIKIEYLQRDLLRNAMRRSEFLYPLSRLRERVAEGRVRVKVAV